jgi:hypothetical protein
VHPASRKFFKDEVFKSDRITEHSVSEVAGRCLVMHIKDYIRGRPLGSKGLDIFVCESRYTNKRMEKIKIWKSCLPAKQKDGDEGEDEEEDEPPLVPFDQPLVLEKVDSPFIVARKVGADSDDEDEDEEEDEDDDSGSEYSGKKGRSRSKRVRPISIFYI